MTPATTYAGTIVRYDQTPSGGINILVGGKTFFIPSDKAGLRDRYPIGSPVCVSHLKGTVTAIRALTEDERKNPPAPAVAPARPAQPVPPSSATAGPQQAPPEPPQQPPVKHECTCQKPVRLPTRDRLIVLQSSFKTCADLYRHTVHEPEPFGVAVDRVWAQAVIVTDRMGLAAA